MEIIDMFDKIHIIAGAILTTLGAALGVFAKSKIENRKENTHEFDKIVEAYREMNKDLQDRVETLESKFANFRLREDKLKAKINQLQNQLIVFESSHSDIPLPMWMKDTKGRLIFINDHYEDTFLLPRGYARDDYLFKNDFSVWPKEVAEDFIKNDKMVMRTGLYNRSIEQIVDANGDIYYADVLKYPRTYQGKVIGISGIITNTSYNKDDVKITSTWKG